MPLTYLHACHTAAPQRVHIPQQQASTLYVNTNSPVQACCIGMLGSSRGAAPDHPLSAAPALVAHSPLAPAGACVAALVGVAPPQRHCRGRSLSMRGGGGTLLVPGFGAILGRECIGGLRGLCAQVGHALQQHVLAQDGVAAVLAALSRTQRCLAPERICTAAICIMPCA